MNIETMNAVELLNKLLARGAVELHGERRIEPHSIWLVKHIDTAHGVGTPEYREIATQYSGRDLVEVLRTAVKAVYR